MRGRVGSGWLAAVLVLGLPSACGGPAPGTAEPAPASPVATGLPVAPSAGPLIGAELSAARPGQWPASDAAVAQLLQRFPQQLGGLTAVSRTGSEIHYGGPGSASASLTVVPLAQAAYPGASMGAFFEEFANSGQFRLTERQPAGSRVLYLVGTTTDQPAHPVAAWARPDGQWLYGAEASDGADLSRLVSTFDAAARASK
jgi:hypothetical protein